MPIGRGAYGIVWYVLFELEPWLISRELQEMIAEC
jgi:hypothetical protein